MSIAKPVRHARRAIYESAWINLFVDKVEFPAGRIIDEHHIIEFPRAAVAALIVNECDEILMVEAYRYTTDSVEWEVPAGGMDAGETPEQTALREAWEETGCRATDAQLLYTFYPINGISDATFHVVTCRAVSQEDAFDANEIRSVRWMAQAEVREMVEQRVIRDGFTLNALLLFWMLRGG